MRDVWRKNLWLLSVLIFALCVVMIITVSRQVTQDREDETHRFEVCVVNGGTYIRYSTVPCLLDDPVDQQVAD